MKFDWAKDRWTSQEYTFATEGLLSYDKFQHFLGGILMAFFVTVMFLMAGQHIWISAIYGSLISVLFWFLWEVKDGLISWKSGIMTTWLIRYNWGGDGFSWRDMLAAWAGAALYLFIIYMVFVR